MLLQMVVYSGKQLVHSPTLQLYCVITIWILIRKSYTHFDYRLYLILIISYANNVLFKSFCDRVVAVIWRGRIKFQKVVIRVLSQMTTFSGCECNWSTFRLIHMKVHNRLSYRWLEKQAYVHYNMRLRMHCAKLDKESEETKINSINLQFYNEDLEPILEWIEATMN